MSTPKYEIEKQTQSETEKKTQEEIDETQVILSFMSLKPTKKLLHRRLSFHEMFDKEDADKAF